MDKPVEKEKTRESAKPDYAPDILELLRLMGQVIHTAKLYGPEHNLTKRSIDGTYSFLVSVLEKCPKLNLNTTEGGLLADGRKIETRNPFVEMLIEKLQELQVSGFSLLKDMSRKEFGQLMGLIISPVNSGADAQGFEEAFLQQNLEHIHMEKVKYERVTDGEAVVSKGDLEGGAGGASEGVVNQLVEQIMAFLKGDVEVIQEDSVDLLKETSTDADKLANLIMEAAAIRQKNEAIADGETLADIVIGCLRRTFDGLMQHPSVKTQKGKKTLKKSLLLLEKNIVEKLRALGERAPETEEAVSQAVEEMTDELEIETLSEEYMKKRHALDKTERRVVRYMKRSGKGHLEETGLEERMKDSGLSPDSWRELLIKGGLIDDDKGTVPGLGTEGGRGIPGGVGALAVLLSELDDMMNMPTADPQATGEKISQLGQQVEALADGTEEKIAELDKNIQHDQELVAQIDEAQKKQVSVSRKMMKELLAEIVQELCQSLSAINCAVGMTRAGHIGDINEEQSEVLGVAAKCGDRLDKLLNRLIEVVGLPAGLTPNKKSVYSP